uniref:Uncharacterized protein n=1 Tax=uncultured organism MedDCM-OCT-S08-C288 TaxID=743637 RepID=D6PJ88_9ZZZZ|nr:hypothetical protein [uncultured organism MedDCM-OCT-S08-C288]
MQTNAQRGVRIAVHTLREHVDASFTTSVKAHDYTQPAAHAAWYAMQHASDDNQQPPNQRTAA